MNVILSTDRLRLKEFTLNDHAFIIELLNSPGWLKYIGDRNVKSVEDAENYLSSGPIKSYAENGFGLSLVETNEGTPIGMCGLIQRKEFKVPDIGFAFLPEYVGKGYAYEISNALMNYAREQLKLTEILAITLEANRKSIRLLERIGLSFKERYISPNSQEELLLYSTIISN